DTIAKLGLELQVIFNKGAVMVLPTGVNKATGLLAALRALGLSPRNTVGVGDAENDHSFLAECECAAAVANALPALKERCDLVLDRERGDGVVELAGVLVDDDLASAASGLGHDSIGDLRRGGRAGRDRRFRRERARRGLVREREVDVRDRVPR